MADNYKPSIRFEKSTDLQIRKPRYFTRTPANRIAGAIAFGIIAAGTGIFLWIVSTPGFNNFRQAVKDGWLDDNERDAERRYLFTYSYSPGSFGSVLRYLNQQSMKYEDDLYHPNEEDKPWYLTPKYWES